MPSLVRLYEEFKNSGFIILAVSVREDRSVVKEYADRQRMPFPVLLDATGAVAMTYGAQATPVHFLVNRKGEAVAAIQGGRDWTTTEHRNLIQYVLDMK